MKAPVAGAPNPGMGKSSGEKEVSPVGTALMPLARALLLDLVWQ